MAEWAKNSPRKPNQPLVLFLIRRIYGSLQNFVSYDFYENMVRYAIQSKMLDSNLKK